MPVKMEIKEALGNIIAGEILVMTELMSLHTSLNVGGNAAPSMLIKSEDQLVDVVRRLRKRK